MDHSMPSLPVYHQLLEFTQTHVHRVGDAIQPSHPLSSPSPPALNLSQHQGLFKWVSSLHQVAKVLEWNISPSNEHPGLISFRMDWCISSESLLWVFLVAQMINNPPAMQNPGFDPCVGKIPWRRKWQHRPVFSKITVDGDCSHEIKRHLLLERKTMANWDGILKAKTLLCQQRSV